MHETIDFKPDQLSHFKTFAVLFGQNTAIKAAHWIFTLSICYWFFLYLNHIISVIDFSVFFIAFAIHFFIFLISKKNIINKLVTYQSIYRFCYLLAGIILGFTKWNM
jgi:4-hydroxybenzoate polyprenyltransferase